MKRATEGFKANVLTQRQAAELAGADSDLAQDAYQYQLLATGRGAQVTAEDAMGKARARLDDLIKQGDYA